MQEHVFVSYQDLETELDKIRQAPSCEGKIELIVCRPVPNQRNVLNVAELNANLGLVGDCWKVKGHKKGPANPDMQINIMNSRATAAIEKNKERWALAGDQFYVDFDISKENLPAGTRIKLGSAILEVTEEPHLGCAKFSERFGKDAVMWVNSDEGKALNLRGINAKVIEAGEVRTGDAIFKI